MTHPLQHAKAARLAIQLIALSIGVVGCGDDGIELSVDVSTDLVPGVEFASVAVSLPILELTARRDAREENFFEPQRIADFDGLAADSERRLRVALLDASGRVVLAREATVNHRADLAVTLTLSRDCRGVACDSAAALQCFGGRCVDPDCVTGTEPSCPEVECRRDDECPALAACASARCVETLCLYAPVEGMCETTEYCVAESGCVPLPDAPDAGPDMSVPDAGGLSPPQVLWPPNGYRVGSGLARFEVAPVAGASDYEFQFEADCPGAEFLTCSFADPESISSGSNTSALQGLNPTATFPGAAGNRFAWRVRACDDTECSEWARPRYVDVARYGRDFDGDGRDELFVGAEEEYFVYQMNGDGTPGERTDYSSPLADATAGVGRQAHSGDFNADGYIDLAIGAPFNAGFGAVIVHLGGPSGLQPPTPILAPADATLNTQFGGSLCSGDFNADGYADLAVSSIRDGIFVYRGSADGLVDAVTNRLTGAALSCADVDQDGFSDIIGGTTVHRGQTGDFGSESISELLLEYIGDLDGDANPDYIGSGSTTVNLVYGAPGRPVGRVVEIAAGHQSFNYQVAAFADLDADGLQDAVIAWPGSSSGDAGSPYMIFGGTDAAVPIANRCGGCRQGIAIVNGLRLGSDRIADAVIGASDGDRVYILLGNSTRSEIVVSELPAPRAGVTSFGQSL